MFSDGPLACNMVAGGCFVFPHSSIHGFTGVLVLDGAVAAAHIQAAVALCCRPSMEPCSTVPDPRKPGFMFSTPPFHCATSMTKIDRWRESVDVSVSVCVFVCA